ncbi:hypothetical protein TERTU_2246 [Teredinibacter turnerae T7901]|uniref:Uncharacterized protein n=1 Tax=Teredinibacter turnerae (strain ATCC 39867 / T7901) TaxID=377629 RepID=C5BJM2_TERTT|nr:hypothetical protein TERTU_2246 [Teredinibacter turnerae T7901]
MALFSGLNERKITHQPGNTGPALRVAAKIPLSALFIAHLEQPALQTSGCRITR